MMTRTDLNAAVAAFLKNGGAVTVCRTAKARGVKKQVMTLTTNRSALNRSAIRSDVQLGISQVNYSRFQDARRACALGKMGLGN